MLGHVFKSKNFYYILNLFKSNTSHDPSFILSYDMILSYYTFPTKLNPYSPFRGDFSTEHSPLNFLILLSILLVEHYWTFFSLDVYVSESLS